MKEGLCPLDTKLTPCVYLQHVNILRAWCGNLCPPLCQKKCGPRRAPAVPSALFGTLWFKPLFLQSILNLHCSLSLVSTSLPVRSKGKFLQCCRPMTLTCIIFCHLDALTHFPKLKSSSLTLSASAVPFILELWQLNPLNLSCFYHWPSLNMRLPCSSNLMVLLGSLPK